MIDYREVIRLKSSGYSNSSIASGVGCSRNTVADIWKRVQERQLVWPIPSTLTNEDLKKILYPEEHTGGLRMLPDYEYVFNELAKPGVNLTLLWSEYCIQCEEAGMIPYQHSDLCQKHS